MFLPATFSIPRKASAKASFSDGFRSFTGLSKPAPVWLMVSREICRYWGENIHVFFYIYISTQTGTAYMGALCDGLA